MDRNVNILFCFINIYNTNSLSEECPPEWNGCGLWIHPNYAIKLLHPINYHCRKVTLSVPWKRPFWCQQMSTWIIDGGQSWSFFFSAVIYGNTVICFSRKSPRRVHYLDWFSYDMWFDFIGLQLNRFSLWDIYTFYLLLCYPLVNPLQIRNPQKPKA